MANSWINAAYVLGFELTLACPEGYDPDQTILKRAQTKAKVTVLRDPKQAAEGAHVDQHRRVGFYGSGRGAGKDE